MSEQAQNLNENEELVEDVQQETTSTEDPLEEAIARVQELEEQLKAQVEETSKKRARFIAPYACRNLIICVVVANKTSKKHINLRSKNSQKTF